MLDVIICANFGVEKLRGLGNTRGQILEFPIEMVGHIYNRAGATAQPVMVCEISSSAVWWLIEYEANRKSSGSLLSGHPALHCWAFCN